MQFQEAINVIASNYNFNVFALILPISIFAVIGFKKIKYINYKNKHPKMDFHKIYDQIKEDILYSTFEEIWLKLEELFNVEKERIKPWDKIKELHQLDSWNLGAAGDNLYEWLKTKNNSEVPIFRTVLDLAVWVEKDAIKSIE